MPGAACLDQTKEGWFIKLKNSAKITAEPSVYKGYAYYPIYEPTKSKNKCSLGNAYICAVDDECGQNTSSLLGGINTNNSNKCGYVGQGVLSIIVFFADKAFANLATSKPIEPLPIMPSVLPYKSFISLLSSANTFLFCQSLLPISFSRPLIFLESASMRVKTCSATDIEA